MACVYVPQRDPTMASLRELLAVRTERKGERPAAWVIENMQFVTRADIPDFHRASPPAARRRPSGLKATARTERLFLANTRPSSPVVTSISSTIPRREWAPSAPVPTASHSPSGLTSRCEYGTGLGRQRPELAPCRHLPDFDSRVYAPRGQPCLVGAETQGDRANTVRHPPGGAHRRAALQPPDVPSSATPGAAFLRSLIPRSGRCSPLALPIGQRVVVPLDRVGRKILHEFPVDALPVAEVHALAMRVGVRDDEQTSLHLPVPRRPNGSGTEPKKIQTPQPQHRRDRAPSARERKQKEQIEQEKRGRCCGHRDR